MAKATKKIQAPTPAGKVKPDTVEDTIDTRTPAARYTAAWRERQRAKGLLPPRKQPPACGTEAKARWHQRHNEDVCDECREATNAAQRARYAARTGHHAPPPPAKRTVKTSPKK